MTTLHSDNVDYRLLNKLSRLVICSRCLRAGTITPVPQVFSKRHRPNNVCSKCLAKRRSHETHDTVGKILEFRN